MQTLQTNSLLQGGRYKIISTLGQGGFGITYLAEQVMLGRKVAVKEFFMKDLCNRDGETSHVSVGSIGSVNMVERFKEKFLKEARLIATMDNSHIVRIYDIFEENGTAYYIMEHIDGGSLDTLVKDGALKESDAIRIIKEVGSALEYIHKQNVLHLDVKPSNILLRSNGEAVLIDFGISKRYDVEGGQTSTTPTGVSKGYAPIEQYNQGLQNFSPATDVYSLGATLYKLLSGQTPPEAPMLLDGDELLACPSNVSLQVWSAVEKAMEPRRKFRPQSIGEWMNLLKGDVMEPISNKMVHSSPKPNMISRQTEETMIITSLSEPNVVDLGLSVKWAATNMGALEMYEAGEFVSWGELMSKETYIPENYMHQNNGSVTHLGFSIAQTQFDAATRRLGKGWRMPTDVEFKELMTECVWTYSVCNGVNGFIVKGPSGNSIFLPLVGCKREGKISNLGYEGMYTTATSKGYSDETMYVSIKRNVKYLASGPKYIGRVIRPVKK
ncbi:MAG: serine/threonine protein kinase [Bacteroidaceae bacterium]|nr:serine/threonine protein kinase [Bacteroidaceae bacterium]